MYSVEKGIIYAAKGIPHCPRWFADGRLAFAMDELGIKQVDYWNPEQKRSYAPIFIRRLWDSFRYYLEENLINIKPQYIQSKIWPFGVEAQWEYKGNTYKHRVMAVDEAIIIEMDTPANLDGDIKFKLEYFEQAGLIAGDDNDPRYSSGDLKRTWKDWTFNVQENCMLGGLYEIQSVYENQDENYIGNPMIRSVGVDAGANLDICISANFPISHIKRARNAKHLLISEPMQPDRKYNIVIAFDTGQEKVKRKTRWLIENLDERIQKQISRYTEVADRSPQLIGPYRHLNDFISLAPMYQEALKILKCPGAIRAKTTNYWVWGWDGITSNHAACYWGDMSFIKDMLLFYKETAHPEFGIGHYFNNDMSIGNASVLPAQGMYINLLYLYYIFTEDIEFTREIYPFAKKILLDIKKTEIQQTGLCKGTALFPDYPDLMKETGEDISVLNNSFYYCAVRAMDYLSVEMGDIALQSDAEDILRRIEDNFIKLFYEEDKQFVVSSVDAKTLDKRDSFNSNSIKWDNSYCEELVQNIHENCLSFFEKNIVCKAGLREIPIWSDAYDADSNQLHCWWPVTGEYYMRLINKYDKRELIEKWVGWVSYWTEMLMCPEGISCYIDTCEPEPDGWTSVPGAWHGYSMRGWYQATIHGIVGVDVEAGGFTFYPYSGKELTLKGLHYRGKIFNIEMKGSGAYIDAIEVNGEIIHGCNKLPADLYKYQKIINIVVQRTSHNPYQFYLEHAYGLELTQYRFELEKMHTMLTGAGICRIKLWSKRNPCVKLDQQIVPVSYDIESKYAIVEVKMTQAHPRYLEITA